MFYPYHNFRINFKIIFTAVNARCYEIPMRNNYSPRNIVIYLVSKISQTRTNENKFDFFLSSKTLVHEFVWNSLEIVKNTPLVYDITTHAISLGETRALKSQYSTAQATDHRDSSLAAPAGSVIQSRVNRVPFHAGKSRSYDSTGQDFNNVSGRAPRPFNNHNRAVFKTPSIRKRLTSGNLRQYGIKDLIESDGYGLVWERPVSGCNFVWRGQLEPWTRHNYRSCQQHVVHSCP